MAAPVLAQITRSEQVESQHRGAIAVTDGEGRLVAAAGDVGQPFFFRSAAKPFQLLPTVESGAAARYHFGNPELSVCVSSHSGAPRHVELVRDILARVGLGPEALRCGYHDPRNRGSLAQVLASGDKEHSPLYDNCSGKHAAMLVLAVHLGADPEGYHEPDHPAQSLIVERTCEFAGVSRREAELGMDGCSVPSLYAPLATLAACFGRLAREAASGGADENTGPGGRAGDGAGTMGRAVAARRIHQAMAASPEMLGETDSFNAVLMAALGHRLIAKGGAEGLFCVAVPEADLGIALRIEDGANRAIPPVVLDLLVQLEVVQIEELGPLAQFRAPEIRNRRGTEITGVIRSALEIQWTVPRTSREARSAGPAPTG
jgi:L-asparaginase II